MTLPAARVGYSPRLDASPRRHDDGPVALQRRHVVGIALAALLVAAGLIAWPWVRIYTGVAPPEQFEAAVPAPVTSRDVLGIAHNAGSNASTTRRALAYGADVIEIDVTIARGRLVAGRAHGVPWLAERVFRGPSLASAWAYSSEAKIIKLDLQRNGRGLLNRLVDFLSEAPPHGEVLVSTRDPDAITYLRPRLPRDVRLIFTVPFPPAEAELRTDADLVSAITGITVFRGLVSKDLVRWAHDRHLLVFAWTVNDGQGMNQMLRAGVDGITTANLAILRALSS